MRSPAPRRAGRPPLLALTMGDPAGIGPEIALACAKDARVRRACRLLLVGSRAAFERYRWRAGSTPILDPGLTCSVKPGRPDRKGGAASFAAVRLAADLAKRGLIDGVVTAPIAKDSWRAAGIRFPDHTDFLREITGASEVAMMLVAENLRSVPVTRHIALRDVPRRLKAGELIIAARLAAASLADSFGIRRPRLGLCAMNPHAGEAGMMGTEERTLLAPAVSRLRRSGVFIDGPIPADAAWAAHRAGRWDALISLYHDQALIPLKITHPYGIVNWTLGIPFVRTSPGHGTAFDIAGKARANPEAMIQAALLAARLSA